MAYSALGWALHYGSVSVLLNTWLVINSECVSFGLVNILVSFMASTANIRATSSIAGKITTHSSIVTNGQGQVRLDIKAAILRSMSIN
jgi:hypothetical protein